MHLEAVKAINREQTRNEGLGPLIVLPEYGCRNQNFQRRHFLENFIYVPTSPIVHYKYSQFQYFLLSVGSQDEVKSSDTLCLSKLSSEKYLQWSRDIQHKFHSHIYSSATQRALHGRPLPDVCVSESCIDIWSSIEALSDRAGPFCASLSTAPRSESCLS